MVAFKSNSATSPDYYVHYFLGFYAHCAVVGISFWHPIWLEENHIYPAIILMSPFWRHLKWPRNHFAISSGARNLLNFLLSPFCTTTTTITTVQIVSRENHFLILLVIPQHQHWRLSPKRPAPGVVERPVAKRQTVKNFLKVFTSVSFLVWLLLTI